VDQDSLAEVEEEVKARKKSFVQQCLDAALPAAADGEKTPLAAPNQDATKRQAKTFFPRLFENCSNIFNV
jgi:hypothetical protein